jgi:hypothetical protein
LRRILSGFVVGVVATAALTTLRTAITGGPGGSTFGSRVGFVLFAGATGGLIVAIYIATETWRAYGGIRWFIAYAAMGITTAILFFLLLAIGGGASVGLAGAPASDWIESFVVLLILGVVLAFVTRKYFDMLGAFPDNPPDETA